jgi:hypothetical protein
LLATFILGYWREVQVNDRDMKAGRARRGMDIPATWREKIKATLDDNDRLFIVDITKQSRDGWLPKQAWDWLREKEVHP